MEQSNQLQELIESFNTSYDQMSLVQDSLKKLAEGTFELSERIRAFETQSNAQELLPQITRSRDQIEAVFMAVQQQVEQVELKVGRLAENGQAAVLKVTEVDSALQKIQQGIETYHAVLESCAPVVQRFNDFVMLNDTMEQTIVHTGEQLGELRQEMQQFQPDLVTNMTMLRDTIATQGEVKEYLTQIHADNEACQQQIYNMALEVQSLQGNIQDYVAALVPTTDTLREVTLPLGRMLEEVGLFAGEARQTLAEMKAAQTLLTKENSIYQALLVEMSVLREDIRTMANENQVLKLIVADFRLVQQQSQEQAEELRRELSDNTREALQLVASDRRSMSEEMAENSRGLQTCMQETIQCRKELQQSLERYNEEHLSALMKKVMIEVAGELKKKEGKGFIGGLFHK